MTRSQEGPASTYRGHCLSTVLLSYQRVALTQTGICKSMFIADLFTIGKSWKQPRCPLMNGWVNQCGIYIQWDFIQP